MVNSVLWYVTWTYGTVNTLPLTLQIISKPQLIPIFSCWGFIYSNTSLLFNLKLSYPENLICRMRYKLKSTNKLLISSGCGGSQTFTFWWVSTTCPCSPRSWRAEIKQNQRESWWKHPSVLLCYVTDVYVCWLCVITCSLWSDWTVFWPGTAITFKGLGTLWFRAQIFQVLFCTVSDICLACLARHVMSAVPSAVLKELTVYKRKFSCSEWSPKTNHSALNWLWSN